MLVINFFDYRGQKIIIKANQKNSAARKLHTCMKSFKEWLRLNEIVGIYPLLYDGLSAYPDLYFVNSSYKVYIDASLKAKTNPPEHKKNLKNRFEQ